MKRNKAIKLLKKFISGKASVEETARIEKWYGQTDKEISDNDFAPGNLNEVKEDIYSRLLSKINNESKIVPFYKKTWFRVSAAAAVLIVVCGLFLFVSQQRSNKNQTAPVTNNNFKNDVAPPLTNKATLTLADGSKIEIDSAGEGVFAKQGNVSVVKKSDGEIAYNGNKTDAVQYNTLTIPKGSKPFKLKLSDGSHVWLNVASSITYPTAFAGKERKVVITGEAYFEVTHNASMPFIVKQANSDMQVQVLGTHFNVNTYDDETSMKVTLLEGAVNVSHNQEHILLAPGEQAQVSNTAIKKVSNANLNEVMAWKNGTFYFNGADIKTIMRQVEKWYNVDIVYKDDINYSFVANISRDVNASQLFKILELTDLVHFKIEGNKITVMK